MASKSSASGAELTTAEAPVTPGLSKPQADGVGEWGPETETGYAPPPEEIQPTKLKLKLRNMPKKPTTDTLIPRRSLRSSRTSTEHDRSSAISEIPPPGKKPKAMEQLQPKHLIPPRTGEMIKSPREAAGAAREQTEGYRFNNDAYSAGPSSKGTTSATTDLGTANDPIDVDALRSPPPHMFVNRTPGYYAPLPLQYRPARPNLPSKLFTPNGVLIHSGQVSGHESHDIYRNFIEGRQTPVPPGFKTSCAKLGAQLSAGMQHPNGMTSSVRMVPAQTSGCGNANGRGHGQAYAAHLPTHYQSYPHDYRAHIASYHTPVHGYPIYPVLNEEHLRQRAVQFVLDHARPRPRKRRLSDDPDETSSSEYEDEEQQPKKKRKLFSPADPPETPSQPLDGSGVSTPSTGVSEDNIFDRNQKLAELVEHTQLLTALLMTYPRSANQQGMREDIAMLATVANKRLEGWVRAENAFDVETRQRQVSATTPSPNSIKLVGEDKTNQTPGSQAEVKERKGMEDDIRRYLLADSGVWDKQGTQATAQEDASVTADKDGAHGRNGSVLRPGDTVITG